MDETKNAIEEMLFHWIKISITISQLTVCKMSGQVKPKWMYEIKRPITKVKCNATSWQKFSGLSWQQEMSDIQSVITCCLLLKKKIMHMPHEKSYLEKPQGTYVQLKYMTILAEQYL